MRNQTINIGAMKPKAKQEKLVKVPESGIMSLVADNLKNKVLFEEKLECAKQYLNKVKISAL